MTNHLPKSKVTETNQSWSVEVTDLSEGQVVRTLLTDEGGEPSLEWPKIGWVILGWVVAVGGGSIFEASAGSYMT